MEPASVILGDEVTVAAADEDEEEEDDAAVIEVVTGLLVRGNALEKSVGK